jgi:hypothetical protein
VLLGLAAEAKLIDQVERIAERIATGELVLQLAEDLADLVFDRVRIAAAAEGLEVREQLAIDIIDQVRTGERPGSSLPLASFCAAQRLQQ